MNSIDLVIAMERAKETVLQLRSERKRVHAVHTDFNGTDNATHDFLIGCGESLHFTDAKAVLRAIEKHATCQLFVAVCARKYFWRLESEYRQKIEEAMERRHQAIKAVRELHERAGSSVIWG